MTHEVWVLVNADGVPQRTALHERRAQPSLAQRAQGYRVVRYVAAMDPPATGWAHTGPCSTGCTCSLNNPLTRA